MFSEELSIMDKNTVMLMIEEQQETIDRLEKDRSQMEDALAKAEAERKESQDALAKAEAECAKLRRELEEAHRRKIDS